MLFFTVSNLHFYKNFVTERKIDEELARTTRFVADKDQLLSMIANFGEGKKYLDFLMDT